MKVGPTARTVRFGSGFDGSSAGCRTGVGRRLRLACGQPARLAAGCRRIGLGRRGGGSGLIGLPCASTRGCDICRRAARSRRCRPLDGGVLDVLQRLRPALAGPPATAGVGRTPGGIGTRWAAPCRAAAADRHRLVDVLAGIAVRVELHLGGRAGCAGRPSRRRGSGPAWSRTRSDNSSRRRCARRRCG